MNPLRWNLIYYWDGPDLGISEVKIHEILDLRNA